MWASVGQLVNLQEGENQDNKPNEQEGHIELPPAGLAIQRC